MCQSTPLLTGVPGPKSPTTVVDEVIDDDMRGYNLVRFDTKWLETLEVCCNTCASWKPEYEYDRYAIICRACRRTEERNNYVAPSKWKRMLGSSLMWLRLRCIAS